MGSYANQTVLQYPNWFVSEKKVRAVGIDNCLLEEIKQLWESGIQTTESCCGHNVAPAYISVVDEHIEKMMELGYVQGSGAGVFEPKTTGANLIPEAH